MAVDISGGMLFTISENGGRELIGTLGEVEQAIRQASGASDSYGKSTNSLTNLIKTQRSEHRLAAYGVRELSGMMMMGSVAMMAMNNATDSTVGTTKLLTKSLMEGFVAFSSSRFAIEGIATAFGKTAGPIGEIASGLIGLGIAAYDFFSKTSEATIDLTEEAKLLNGQFEFFDLNLERIAKKMSDFSNNRVASEMNQAFLNLAEINDRTDKLNNQKKGMDPGSNDAKSIDMQLAALNGQKKAEEDVVAAAIEERKIRSGILSSAQETLDILEKQFRYESDPSKKRQIGGQIDIARANVNSLGMTPAQEEEDAKKRLDEYAAALEKLGEEQGEQYEQDIKDSKAELSDEETILKYKNERKVLSDADYIVQLKTLANAYAVLGDYKDQEKILAEIYKVQQNSVKDYKKNLDELGSTASSIQSTMALVGINANSFVSEFLTGLQDALSIVKTIEETIQLIHDIKMAGGILSFLGILSVPIPKAHSGLMLGSNYQGNREAIVKVHAGEEIITPYDPRHRKNGGSATGGSINVNYNVSANDSRSFESMMNTPGHRRALQKAFARAMRSTN